MLIIFQNVLQFNIFIIYLFNITLSMPWMNLGISIIYIKPRQAPPSFLSFLEPFGNDVWISMVLSILVVAMMTFVIGKL